MTRRKRNFWIEVVLLFLIVASIGTALTASELQPLNKSDIKLHVSDLRTFAASGELLIDQNNSGKLTEQFFDSQISQLEEKVSTTAQTLREAKAETSAQEAMLDASSLADRLLSAVNSLKGPSSTGARSQFDQLKNECKQLEDRLKNE
jgi:hypothetical protein